MNTDLDSGPNLAWGLQAINVGRTVGPGDPIDSVARSPT